MIEANTTASKNPSVANRLGRSGRATTADCSAATAGPRRRLIRPARQETVANATPQVYAAGPGRGGAGDNCNPAVINPVSLRYLARC